jgi:hypothetical protein
MKSLKSFTILAFGVALSYAVANAVETPAPAPVDTKAKCCVKAEKAGETCKHECCEAAAKEGKNCEKCGGTNAPKK